MAISYPQICPDSRSFAPGQYATTQPAYLEYVESGRQWSGVPFGSELQLGYEDLSEADAALFTDAYEDSRSGFHVLDIGTEPAGGIGDAGLAARITATTWKFAETPVVEAKGNALYRVSVKLTSDLPAFSSADVTGILPPSAEPALAWSDTGIGGQPVCSGPIASGHIYLQPGTKTLAIWLHELESGHTTCGYTLGIGGGEYATTAVVTGAWTSVLVRTSSAVYRECTDSLVSPLDSNITYLSSSPVQLHVLGYLADGTEQVLYFRGLSSNPYETDWPGGYFTTRIGWRDITIVDRTNNIFYGPYIQTKSWRKLVSGEVVGGPERPNLSATSTWDPYYLGRNPAYT